LFSRGAVQPDGIVMDLALPRLGGWEATHRLKKDSVTAHIPVLACTAHVFVAARDREAASVDSTP